MYFMKRWTSFWISSFKGLRFKCSSFSVAVELKTSTTNWGYSFRSSFIFMASSFICLLILIMVSGTTTIFPVFLSGLGNKGLSFSERLRVSNVSVISSLFSFIGSITRAFVVLIVLEMGSSSTFSSRSDKSSDLWLISSVLFSFRLLKTSEYQAYALSPSI